MVPLELPGRCRVHMATHVHCITQHSWSRDEQVLPSAQEIASRRMQACLPLSSIVPIL